MKKTEFNKLLEKAFSIGYETFQKEFGNKENKKKRKEWEWKEADKIGQKMMRDGIEMSKGDAIRAQRLKNIAETHGGTGRYFDEYGNKYDIYSDALVETATKKGKGRNVHHRINTRAITKNNKGELTKGSFTRDENQDSILSDLTADPHANSYRYETMRTGGKRKKVLEDNNKIEENSNIKKNILNKKNLEKAGLALTGTAAVAGVAYGINKYRKKKKAKKEEEEAKRGEEKSFSKKISRSDKSSIKIAKNWMTSRERKNVIDDLEDKKSIKRGMLGAGLRGAAIGAIVTPINRAILDGEINKDNLIRSAKDGAIAGGVLHAGFEGIKRKIHRNRLKDPKYALKTEKRVDQMRVADGQMSEEKYLEKWGK